MTSAARLRDAALLHAENICLTHGTVAALDGVSLDVRAGELLTILGPSGSGKTSLLRVLAGLETPQTADALTIDGADMRAVPAHLRPTATVFQHYALFPHLTAGANVEYGLRVRGVPRAARRALAERALALLRLADKYDRRIDQLSGGERQRVAFARALVTRPLLLLLDEPMGALDERLRATLEADIRALQQSQGMTIVQVTHSRDEALSMSDRIVVMHAGRVVQIGAPEDIFERPSTRFVAAFMGAENLIAGRIAHIGPLGVRIACGAQMFAGPWTGEQPPHPGQLACLAVHSDRVRPGAGACDDNLLDAAVRTQTYRGTTHLVQVRTPAGDLALRVARLQDGAAPTQVHWRPADCAIFPDEEQAR